MSLNELSEKVGLTLSNLSILKTGKAKAIRFSTLEAICIVLDCQPGDILEYHYLFKKTTYLMWWAIGVLTFGLGTLAESINILIGWSAANVRYWYIVGALLGGFPLAQGSVYLLMKKKFADSTSILLSVFIVVASISVILTPILLPDNFDYKLSGKVFEWKW
eukprot:gene20576-40395_t